ncbi:MAG: HAMP domain-containing histidine kinase [Cytophagales bacterium]|nr:HAMP domain-containing histidine kinase [Cytophagales bacterium]
MSIRTRLTILFTAVVMVLLLLFCLAIFLLAERYRREEFYQRLEQEAYTSAELLFGRSAVSPELFKLLDKNQMTVLNQEEIIIYDQNNKLVYESGEDYLTVTPETLLRVRLEGKVRLREGRREVVGVRVSGRQQLVVFASAVDKYGFSKQQNLAFVLSVGWLVATLCVLAVGWLYAGRMLQPMQRIVARMDEITASRLNLRLETGDGRDEIAQLAQRFNDMLDRLEEAFRVQRAFVSNASHELRTPLTAITGQLEVSLLADEIPPQLRQTMQSVLDDVRELNRLTNGLLTLAGMSLDEAITGLMPVAVDELLWQVRKEVLKTRPNAAVRLDLEEGSDNAGRDPDASRFVVPANESLLRVALFNLMENGCKFSPDNQVSVQASARKGFVWLRFHNRGLAIPPADLAKIFEPFRRGSNARAVPGHGIGLSLTERIVRIHRGSITVESDEQAGTSFVLKLPTEKQF